MTVFLFDDSVFISYRKSPLDVAYRRQRRDNMMVIVHCCMIVIDVFVFQGQLHVQALFLPGCTCHLY